MPGPCARGALRQLAKDDFGRYPRTYLGAAPETWALRPGAWTQGGTYRDVVISNDVAKANERDLMRGTAEIAASLERSDRARMVAEVHVFIAALEHDLIDLFGFAPSGRLGLATDCRLGGALVGQLTSHPAVLRFGARAAGGGALPPALRVGAHSFSASFASSQRAVSA